jgi:cell fate regulator YaaT (PSP1 superfamily)
MTDSATIVQVRFKGNRREFFQWGGEPALGLDDPVIVEADRGQDLGWIAAVGEAAERKCGLGCAGCEPGDEPASPSRQVVRPASGDEARLTDQLRRAEEDDRRKVMERVTTHRLAMKVSDAEWQWDRKKLTVYFTAEKRVDFRALVRDLASLFHTRIELRQIGARDEAKRLDGVGRCGRQYCCSSWLPELMPVSLSLAKDQRLSLNPSQISGGCGRLLCCLRYEHEFYVASRKRFPKEGRTVRTAVGVELVVAADILRERVTLRGEDGAVRTVPLTALKQEIEQLGPAPPPTSEPTAPPPVVSTEEAAAQSVAPRPKRRRRRRGRRGNGGGTSGAG